MSGAGMSCCGPSTGSSSEVKRRVNAWLESGVSHSRCPKSCETSCTSAIGAECSPGKIGVRRTVLDARPKPSDETLTRWTRTLAAAAALSAAAAAAPPAAWAHARLVSASPSDGAVLPTAPRQVTIRFDEPVRALSGTTVVANSGKRPVVAGKPRTHARVLAISLRKLGDGDYTVRWRVLSDDGHTVQGVFPFAVGAGRAPPSAALTPGGTNLTREVISRWFFFAGLLVAVGVALFLPLAWKPALRAAGAEEDEVALWPLAFAGFFLAFLGASALIPDHGAGTTRFGLTYEIGGIVAIVGATLSAIALVDRRLGRGAFVCALALLPVPSIAGHALDRGQWPRPLNVAAELVVLAGLVIAVAFLTDLAPGRQFARTVARPQAPRPIAAPPPDATVLAGESGDRAVGLAVSPRGKLQATVLGGEGNGVDGLSVAFRAGGRTFDATGCGPGCYRARGRIQARRVTVVLDSGPVAFGIPVRTEQASAAVAAARRAFAGLRSLVIHERRASSPRDKVVTTWRIVAPDRLTYVTSVGTRALVIGKRRWDADDRGPFGRC